MRIYLYDDWVRIETDYGTWKYDHHELTDIQRTVDREVDDDDIVEIKHNGYHQTYLISHEVETYIEEWYETEEEYDN